MSGKKIAGYNVTTNRVGQDVARSASFLAIFVSTHFLGMLGLLGVLWAIFTLLGWNQFGSLVSGKSTAILSYIVGYLVVKIFLTRVVMHKWLSEKGSAKRPRYLSDFTFCLSVYHVFTGASVVDSLVCMRMNHNLCSSLVAVRVLFWASPCRAKSV
jgi:uncharacterized membrane protein